MKNCIQYFKIFFHQDEKRWLKEFVHFSTYRILLELFRVVRMLNYKVHMPKFFALIISETMDKK